MEAEAPRGDWSARGAGRRGRARGGGEAGAVNAVIREGKVPCAGSRAGARSYGGRSGRAGPRRSRWRRRTPLGPRLAPLGDSVGPRRGTRGRGLSHAAMGGVGEPGRGHAQPGAPLPTFRWEQIRQHNLPGDKWLVIERRVYDISRWAQRHPGGSRLIGHHGAEDATVRKPTAGRVKPGAGRGLVVGTGTLSTCGVWHPFYSSLTFDLLVRDQDWDGQARA